MKAQVPIKTKVFYLGGTSDHVLDEIPVAGGVDDGDVVLGSLELPESDIDGDTTLTLGLQLVQHPGILERTLAHLKKSKVFVVKFCLIPACTSFIVFVLILFIL